MAFLRHSQKQQQQIFYSHCKFFLEGIQSINRYCNSKPNHSDGNFSHRRRLTHRETYIVVRRTKMCWCWRVFTHTHTHPQKCLYDRAILLLLLLYSIRRMPKESALVIWCAFCLNSSRYFSPSALHFLPWQSKIIRRIGNRFIFILFFSVFFFCVRCQRRHTKARHSMVLSSFLFLQTNSSVVIHIWLSNRLCKTIWRNSKKWMLAPDNLINCSEKCWHSWLSIDRRWWLEFNKRFPLTIYVATLPLTRRVRQVLFNNTPKRSYTHTTNPRPN